MEAMAVPQASENKWYKQKKKKKEEGECEFKTELSLLKDNYICQKLCALIPFVQDPVNVGFLKKQEGGFVIRD